MTRDHINPDIGSINAPTAIGDGAIGQKIENMYQLQQFADLFEEGVTLLDERHYSWARRAFARYLQGKRQADQQGDGKTERDEATKRATAYVYHAIASLDGLRPHHHGPQEVAAIARDLVRGRADRLAPVLAALLRGDTNLGGIWQDADLAALAGSADIDRLAPDDVRLLVTHLAPFAGPAWQGLRARASDLGMEIEAYEAVPETVQAEPRRREQVPKYFIRDPVAPTPATVTPAVVLLFSGIAAVLGSCLSLRLGVEAAGTEDGTLTGVCLGIILLGAAVGLFIACSGSYTRYKLFKAASAEFERQWRRAQPKPSDEQMDGWLSEDTNRIVALGAERHRLRRKLIGQGGSLLDEPQVLVGISGRTQQVTRLVPVPDSTTSSGVRLVNREFEEEVASYRPGDDGAIRADNYRVLAIFLTRDRLCVFDAELELATRRLVTERRLAFRYRDIVAVEVATVPASAESVQQIRDRLADLLVQDPSQIRAVEDEQFTLSIIDGDKVRMRIGFSISTQGQDRLGRQVAWDNIGALRDIEGQVWRHRDDDR
nr:hypothetical protein [Micromonospora sp. DSM 115978]